MHCSSNSRRTCSQGHQPCPTPWLCGGFVFPESAEQQARINQANSAPIEPTEAQEAADRASAPVTADRTQLTFRDWFLAIAVGLMVACGFGAALFR